MAHTVFVYIILSLLVFCFFYDFYSHKRPLAATQDHFYLSLNTTTALKGIAAFIIVCHHFCLYQYDYINKNPFTFLIAMNGGNFALVLFLFLSGYGITKSELSNPNGKHFFKRRFWKILKPCLIIYGLSFISYYYLLPNGISSDDITNNSLNPFVASISSHDISVKLLLDWFFVKMDWYVYTTLVLYLFFYITTLVLPFSDKMSADKVKRNRILLVLVIIAIYYVICCPIYTPMKAHYYRNLWAFAFGVIIAYYPNLLREPKHLLRGVVVLLLLTLFNVAREGFRYGGVTFIAVLILYYLGRLNQKYETNSSLLLYIGGFSYPLYLCHRTFYNLLWGFDLLSFPLFIVCAVTFAILYHRISKYLLLMI